MEWKGQYGGPGETGFDVVGDAGAWGRLWRKLGQDAPALDWERRVAVAVFAGERATGGFSIEFLEPEMRGDDLLVRYRIKAPTGLTTQAFAQPWTVRAFAKPKGAVIVEAAAK